MGNEYSSVQRDAEYKEIQNMNPNWADHLFLFRPLSYQRFYPFFNRIRDVFAMRLMKYSIEKFYFLQRNTFLFIHYKGRYVYVYFLKFGVLFYYAHVSTIQSWNHLYVYCDHPMILRPRIEYVDQFP